MYFKQYFSANLWRILLFTSLITIVMPLVCNKNLMTFNAWSGSHVCNPAGDVDGDTYPDIICGSTGNGSAYLVFGRSDPFPSSFDISAATLSDGVIKITGPSAGFGWMVNGVGDLNGDSFDDFAVSNPNGAMIYIYFGKARASWTSPLATSTFTTGTDGFKIYSSTTSSFSLGYDLKRGGDFNKDGKKDLLVTTASPARLAFIIWGGLTTWSDINVNTMLSSVGIKISGSSGNCQFVSIDYAGDLNDDGTDDIVVGCFTNKAIAIFGKAGLNSNIDVDTFSIPTDGIVLTKSGSNEIGHTVCRLGDVNGDDVDDFFLVNLHDPNHIVFGKAGITNIDLSTLGSGSGVILTGAISGGSCGYAGDLNGDGYNDIVFNPFASGYLGLIWGGPHLTTIGTINMLALDASIGIRTPTLSALLTGIITFPLDVNKDGILELYQGTNDGHLYQFTPCCTVSQYLTGTGYDSCAECSTLNPDCTACTNANTCTACSGGKTPQGNKCIDPVYEAEDDSCCLPGFTFCLSAWSYTGIGFGAGFGVMTILYLTLRRSCINRKRLVQIRPQPVKIEAKPLADSPDILMTE